MRYPATAIWVAYILPILEAKQVMRMSGKYDSVLLHDDSSHIVRIVFEIVKPLVDLLCVEWNPL